MTAKNQAVTYLEAMLDSNANFCPGQWESIDAIVVASDAETGGTWAGATETLKNDWAPVFVLEHDQMPQGNRLLLQKGAAAFPHPFKDSPLKLTEWLNNNKPDSRTPVQPGLFQPLATATS